MKCELNFFKHVFACFSFKFWVLTNVFILFLCKIKIDSFMITKKHNICIYHAVSYNDFSTASLPAIKFEGRLIKMSGNKED